MGYAFISYSSKNQASADALRNLLNGKGVKTWMAPGDIPVGSSYMKEINVALKNCACLVLLLSNAAQGSQWVIKEVERAIAYKKPLIPVQIEDVILNDDFEFILGTCQVAAVQKIDPDSDAAKKVLSRIMAITGTEPEEGSRGEENRTFYLVSVENGNERFPLKNGLNIIGREMRKAAVLLDGPTVSRIHAAIYISSTNNTIRNINATTGTYVNGQRLSEDEERVIHEGDIVGFGDEKYVFRAKIDVS